MVKMRSLFAVLALFISTSVFAQSVKIKDLVYFEGVRTNNLVGYGLVVGLDGTGDSLRNSPFTEELLTGMLADLGVNVRGEGARAKNVAAVVATARLPAFSRTGSHIDVMVSAIGDASNLTGGTLVMTPLKGADGQIYALAQGSVISGGVSAEGEAARVVLGVPTSGTVTNGAQVEREVPFELGELRTVRLALKEADFSTAHKIEKSINALVGTGVATTTDPGTVEIDITGFPSTSTSEFLASIENLKVRPETTAKVIVDQKSATIVIGEEVKISRVAVSQGNLTVRVSERPVAVQPNPFAEGETVVIPRTDIQLEEQEGIGFADVPTATTLSDLIVGLNSLGVSARDMIEILKAIKAAGALHATLTVI